MSAAPGFLGSVRAVALAGCLALAGSSTGCMTATHAEDPLPGAAQRSAVVADEHGDALRVLASALLPLSVDETQLWIEAVREHEKWLASAAPTSMASGVVRETTVAIAEEAPGWSRVSVEVFPFASGNAGEAEADSVRTVLVGHLMGLRLRAEEAVLRGTTASMIAARPGAS